MKTSKVQKFCLTWIATAWIICLIFHLRPIWSDTIIAIWYGFSIIMYPICNDRQNLFTNLVGALLIFTPASWIN